MNKRLGLYLLLSICLLSCEKSNKGLIKEPNKLEIAEAYYKALNDSNRPEILAIIGDSIVIREHVDNYEEWFSKNGYTIWLAWDSVFDPSYRLLEIKKDSHGIKTKVSKVDKRLSFLNEGPMVWYETLRFRDDKIVKVVRTKYEVFDVSKFIRKRDSLIRWIDDRHPELSGFLYPQTIPKAQQYLKAIELYNKRNQ